MAFRVALMFTGSESKIAVEWLVAIVYHDRRYTESSEKQ